MSIKKLTSGGLTIVDVDDDRVYIEPALDDAGKIEIQAAGIVRADRSDIEELVQYLTKWLEETPIPDGWYVIKWRSEDRAVSAARVYGGVYYDIWGRRIEPFAPNKTVYLRRLGDLAQEDISTLNKEDM